MGGYWSVIGGALATLADLGAFGRRVALVIGQSNRALLRPLSTGRALREKGGVDLPVVVALGLLVSLAGGVVGALVRIDLQGPAPELPPAEIQLVMTVAAGILVLSSGLIWLIELSFCWFGLAPLALVMLRMCGVRLDLAGARRLLLTVGLVTANPFLILVSVLPLLLPSVREWEVWINGGVMLLAMFVAGQGAFLAGAVDGLPRRAIARGLAFPLVLVTMVLMIQFPPIPPLPPVPEGDEARLPVLPPARGSAQLPDHGAHAILG